MRKTKEQKGITLIALIITIIVLLILAVVAISAVQDDGIINYAKNARGEYGQAQVNENTTLQNYLDQIKENVPTGTGTNENEGEGTTGDSSNENEGEGTTGDSSNENEDEGTTGDSSNGNEEETPEIVRFTITDENNTVIKSTAEVGMSFEEWANSDYDVGNLFIVYGDYVVENKATDNPDDRPRTIGYRISEDRLFRPYSKNEKFWEAYDWEETYYLDHWNSIWQ